MEMMEMTADALRAGQAVAEAGRALLREGLVARTWGNVSCRADDASFVITPSGLGYEGMRPEDTVRCRIADGSYTGSRKPSSEKGVHAAVYARFPEAGFVIHTHQTYASALGLAGFDAGFLSEEEQETLGGAALAAYGLPGTKRLVAHISAALDTGAHTVLMAHHGALFAGRDAEEAFAHAKRFEELCRARCKGQPDLSEPGDGALAARLTECAKRTFGHAAFTTAPAVAAAAKAGKALPAQLDDLAQMIGPRLPVAAPEEKTLLAALQKCCAVLVPGAGAICRAETEGDLAALLLLAEKACVCFLHARACGEDARLSLLDAGLMRLVYKRKYEKKMQG